MRTHIQRCLRNHIHVLLILPVVIVVMTWPTFARLFDADEFWVHNHSFEIFHRVWDSWHIGQVLTGQAELWYSIDTFHPRGASLAFQHFTLPHALMMLALKQIMAVDSANNLIFLLILFFNGISVYVLILHLLKDKWVALFGAAVAVLSISFSSKKSVPELICFGTMPLTLYFLHRAIFEGRRLYAALAGFCAGLTAYISMYILVFILLGTGIYTVFLLPTRWRQGQFWRLLLVFAALCAVICAGRLYPMVVDSAILQEGLTRYESDIRSTDLLNYFVHTRNPFTGSTLHSIFNVPPGETHRNIYLGYINLFFLACALLGKARHKCLLPWLALFVFFALMRLGDFLTINSVAYRDILLPAHVLKELFPIVFQQVGVPNYYLYALITPFAVLSCFGFATLLRGKPARARALAALAAILIVSIEYYAPLRGISLPKGATAYINWLKTDPEDPIKLINLPRIKPIDSFALFGQTLTGYPTAFGFLWRTSESTFAYVARNWLLREWLYDRSGSCFGRAQAYHEALDALLSDDFSHIVLHRWSGGTEQAQHSFARVPAAYDDGLVAIYRLRDMRLGCVDLPAELAAFDHFLNSPLAEWHPGTSLLSFHPRERFDDDQFAYLDTTIANTTNWNGLLHLHFDEGEPNFQTAADSRLNVENFAKQSQAIYVLHTSRDLNTLRITYPPPLDQFHACERQNLEDGWAIDRLLRREFSCALFDSPAPLQALYDNGARLANALVALNEDHLEIQLRWDALPLTSHAISVQFFDGDGSKVHNQDFVIGMEALARHRLDISALQPGDYAVKLIFYDFNTRTSVSGALDETGVRFERELEIAAINRP